MSSIFNDYFNTKNDKENPGEIQYLNDPDLSQSPLKIKANVFGKVQGVGFRYATLQLAQKLGVNGFVRNETDGSVYVEGSAKAEIIDEFIHGLANGPAPTSSVNKVVVEYDASLANYLDFKIHD